MEPPQRLVEEIHDGHCVAFVGAGFSQPVVPTWKDLLQALASAAHLAPEQRTLVDSLLGQESTEAKHLEAVAQVVRDALGDEEFGAALSAQMPETLNDAMERRLDMLRGIPFRAVLTTNFDGVVDGPGPGRAAYQSVLRPENHRWWDDRYWGATRRGQSTVTLHGSISDPGDIVFTRRDYRRRLYNTPGYLTFVRSLMATTTVFYLGFSFTDAYLDELRSEILALLQHTGQDQPIAYALMPDVTPAQVAFARDHEGIHVLPYSSADGHREFDAHLEALHRFTNPALRLGGLLSDARVLWVDPDDDSIARGFGYLADAIDTAGGRGGIESVADTQAALDRLGQAGADLVITRWGHGEGPDGLAAGEHLLQQMRRQDLRAPVVVFASGAYADENKRTAMALGAAGFQHRWQGLFREIERIFTPGSQLS